jgi:DNA polymerase-3 subunit beta
MKVSVSQENLKKALTLSERATSRTSTLPILNNILLKTENGRLKVSATNLEVGVHCVIGAKIERDGGVAVPAKTVSDFVSSSPPGNLTLSVNNNTLTLKSSSYQTTILGFDTTEYPIIPKIGGGVLGVVAPDELRAAFTSVVDATAVSENRPELSGVFMGFRKDGLTLAATDSFRLAERSIAAKNQKSETVIVPRMTAMEVLRMCDHVQGSVDVRVGENQIAFCGDDTEVISRLVEGRYPDYQKIIPEKTVSRVLVSRQELDHAVRLASVFSSNISDITLACKDKALRVSAKNSAKGDATVTVASNLKGEPFEVSVNHHYLGDGLKAVPGDEVVLEYTGAGNPFIIRMTDEPKSTLYLVMPLRN